jgi:hypothetical protein
MLMVMMTVMVAPPMRTRAMMTNKTQLMIQKKKRAQTQMKTRMRTKIRTYRDQSQEAGQGELSYRLSGTKAA